MIILDSHDFWPTKGIESADFVEFLLSLPNLKYSIPCNIGTNLLKIRDETPKLQSLLRQAVKIGSSEWFLYFRNCEFDAIKASRAIFPYNNRPYFISSHLPPFQSSWIILSNNYTNPIEKHLPVKDLVFVFQLTGTISGRLTVTNECSEYCSDQVFKLNAGETLVFHGKMWKFYYNYNINSQINLTITFIEEIQAE